MNPSLKNTLYYCCILVLTGSSSCITQIKNKPETLKPAHADNKKSGQETLQSLDPLTETEVEKELENTTPLLGHTRKDDQTYDPSDTLIANSAKTVNQNAKGVSTSGQDNDVNSEQIKRALPTATAKESKTSYNQVKVVLTNDVNSEQIKRALPIATAKESKTSYNQLEVVLTNILKKGKVVKILVKKLQDVPETMISPSNLVNKLKQVLDLAIELERRLNEVKKMANNLVVKTGETLSQTEAQKRIQELTQRLNPILEPPVPILALEELDLVKRLEETLKRKLDMEESIKRNPTQKLAEEVAEELAEEQRVAEDVIEALKNRLNVVKEVVEAVVLT